MLHAGGQRDSPSAVAAMAPAGMEPDPREPPGFPPAPVWGLWGDTGALHQGREAMCQPGESLGGAELLESEPQEVSALAPSSPQGPPIPAPC